MLTIHGWILVFRRKRKRTIKNIDDEQEIKDRFYKDLSFGTGGIRGIVGLGTNRINKYTIAKATEGLSNYLIHNFKEKAISVAIAYDCRNDSLDFAKKLVKYYVHMV